MGKVVRWVLLIVLILGTSSSTRQTSASRTIQSAPSPAIVKLEPSPAQVYQGQTMKFRAIIYNVTNLFGFDLRLAWDTAFLDYESHNATPDCLVPPIFATKDEVNASDGTYWLAVATLSMTGFTGNGEAFEITFNLLGLGTTTVNFTENRMSEGCCPIWNIAVDATIFITLGGDVDGNRHVSIFDIVRMGRIYGVTTPDPQYDRLCDIDSDGDIDIFDIQLAAGNYGESW